MRWLRWGIFLALVGFAVFTWWMLLHPPMRLMPTPAVFVQEGKSIFGDLPEEEGERIELFFATNRLPVGPRTNRIYSVLPGTETRFGRATVRIGDEGFGWENIYRLSTTPAGAEDRPFLHLERMAELASVAADEEAGPAARVWFAAVDAALAEQRSRDIIIYVHGANTTVERGVGQAAQLHHFTGRSALVIVFVWPTAENFLRYSRDLQTALGAAPHLARLIEDLAANTSAEKIDVFTYSAGATVGSEALALLGRHAAEPGAADPRLGDAYHAAPDADFRQFVDDMQDYAGLAHRVTVSANMADSALRLSQVISRASRAGRPDIEELTPEATDWLLGAADTYGAEMIQVRPENLPGLSRTSHTFWYEDPWISSDVLISLLFGLPAAERGLDAGTSSAGVQYWTYPPDYPERLAAVVEELRARPQ